MNPCFDTDLLKKGYPFTPEQRASIAKILREDYIDHGVPLDKAARALANDLGIHPEAVIHALAGPKATVNVRRQTSALFAREAARKTALSQAKQLIANADKNKFARVAGRAYDLQREASVWGHFAVYAGTHMKDSFLIPSEWGNVATAYGKAFRLAGRDWQAYHEFSNFKLKNDAEYGNALKSGLGIKLSEEFAGKRAAAAFDFIKEQRLEIWKRWAKDLAPEEQKAVSDVINHATGAVQYSSPGLQNAMGKLLFAPKLLFAQLKTAFVDLPRAFASYAKSATGVKVTPGERAARSFVFRRMAQMAAVQTAALGANAVAGHLFGKDYQPNLTDKNKSNFLNFHVAGHSFGISTTLNWLKFPVRVISKALTAHDQQDSIVNDIWNQYVYHAHPTIGLGKELLFGEDTFSHRPLPTGGLLGSPKPKPGKPTIGYTEFLSQRLPIPIAAASREFYDAMISEGMNHPTAKAWTEFSLGGATALTGFHEHADYPGEYTPSKSAKPVKTRDPGWLQQIQASLGK